MFFIIRKINNLNIINIIIVNPKHKKVCGNSYMKEYKDYIFVDSVGKILRPEYITDHFSLLLKSKI